MHPHYQKGQEIKDRRTQFIHLKNIIAILLCVSGFLAKAQNPDTTAKIDSAKILALPDTVRHLESRFLSFIPPAVFISYGILSLEVKGIRQVDYNVYDDLIRKHPTFRNHIENYFQYAPAMIVYGLNLAGIQGKNTFIDRSALYLLSNVIAQGTTFATKRVISRERPDRSDNYSFPSGHTANAFAAAEFMAQEYAEKSPWFGVIGYSFATATAVLRVYNRDHWFSDIITGAGVGILSTKAAYLLYPLIRNTLFRVDNETKSSIVIPTYQNGVTGFAFIKRF